MLIGVLTGGITGAVTGQNPVITQDVQLQSDLEEMVRRREGPADMTEITDYLQQLQHHPVNLNTAGREDLEGLLFLNEFQIASLLEYRRQTGPLLSLSELQLVYGFDREVIRRIAPFVTVGNGKGTPEEKRNRPVRQELLTRLRFYTEKEEGYRPAAPEDKEQAARYHGSRAGLLFRYTLDAGKGFHAGLVGDKDPGEPMFREINRQGFDFYSGYLQWSPHHGWLRQVNAGHYHLRFGQGLLLWNGFSINRPSAVTDLVRHAPPVRYASSSVESNYLRGLSLVLGKGRFSVLPFFSYTRRDARLFSPDTLDPSSRVILSFPSSGLHRTPTEIDRKGSAGETSAGVRFSYRHGSLSAGLNSLYTSWEYPWESEEKPGNNLLFRGRELFAGSIDYRWLVRRLSLFGEAALTGKGEGAYLQGIRWYLSPLVTTSLLFRHYAPGYFSPYAQALSRTGTVNNETGLFLGLLLRPAAGVTLTGSIDLLHFPWLRYGVDAPSDGAEAGATLSWQPSDQIEVNIRYRHEEQEHNRSLPGEIMREVVSQNRDHLRLQISYPLTTGLTATNRLDLTSFKEDTDQPAIYGFFICQDLHYRPTNIPVSMDLRFGIFDTQYPTRVYTYERDLLYAFSTPSLTGKGIRWYFTGRYQLHRHLQTGIRIARTLYSDRQTAGSGLSSVTVPHRTEIKIQLRVRL
jgi:hypothetical protein